MKIRNIFSLKSLELLKKITVFNLILFFVNVTVFINGGNLLLQCITLAAVILFPGVILTKLFNIEGSFEEKVGYIVVCGLTHLIFLGLIINTFLPLFEIEQPLRLLPFFISFNISVLILFTLSLLLGRSYRQILHLPKTNTVSKVFMAVSVIFPFLTLIGTIYLNNGGSNIGVFSAFIGIPIYIIFVVIFRKSLSDFVFPFSIFMIGFALLLMYSARTPFLMGWDIQNEFRVFGRTHALLYWNPISRGDTYNATLGVTILPTLIGNILTVKSFYIFKFLYPLFFSFTTIAVYYLLRQYLSKIAAYLGTFFCICQLSFVSMPSLARQEIGYLLFAYILLILFDKINSKIVKGDMTLFFGVAMVITHYSTTYVAVLLFLITYVIGLVIRLLSRFIPIFRLPKTEFKLNIYVVLLLLCVTIGWYGLYTQATDNVQNLFISIKNNLLKIHTEEGKAQQSWITITGTNREATAEDLKKYVEKITFQYRFDPNNLSFYDLDIVDKYPVHLVKVPKIPGDPLVQSVIDKGVLYVRQLIKVFMLFGLFYVAFIYFIRKKMVVTADFLIMGFVYMFFIVAAIFVPSISKQYNMERLYQQGLMILVFFPVVVIQHLRKKGFTTIKYLLLTCIFVIYFFSHHGMIIQLVGGEPSVTLNNFGDEFDQYYIYDAEQSAANWYFSHRNKKLTVYADQHARLRLASKGNIDNIISDIIPPVVFKESYVYTTHKNNISGSIQGTIGSLKINFNFPTEFLDDNKNLIYSNKTSLIYR